MEVVANSYLPGDQRLVDKIVYELKAQGIFDQFRKECFADVDTKPAYQNLRQRVEGSVAGFLKEQSWRPDMNKNQVREMLRKRITESGYLETGVERIVDQVVNPKINSVFLPKVEEVVYSYLGIKKPTRNNQLKTEPCDLLPNDLEAVSPESEPVDKKEDKSSDNFQDLDETKTEEDESPPFEPLEEQSEYVPQEENSVDSHLSGFSGLISHESNQSNENKVIPMEQDSQMSRNSSDSRLSIVTSDENSKMEICEDSQSKSVKSTDSNSKHDADRNKPKSSDRHKSRSESKSDRDRKSSKDSKSRHSSSSKDKDRSHDKKDSKSASSSCSSNSSNKNEKDKDKSKDKNDKDRNKTSSISKHSSHNSNSSSSSSNRDKNVKKDSSKSDKDKDRDKDKSKSSSSHKDSKPKDKSSDSKSREKSSSSDKHKHSSSSHGDRHKKDKENKDKKKDSKPKDDHYSSRDKKNDRRSTDRDSNDGQSSKPNSSSSTTENSSSQTQKTTQSSSSGKGDSGNSEQTDNTTKAPVIITGVVEDSEIIISPPGTQRVKVFKPKCAANMQEALKLRKIRKQLAKLEKQNQLSLASVDVSSPLLLSSSINLDDLKDSAEKEVVEQEVVQSPLENTVISKDNWDAMEAKLRQEVCSEFNEYNYDSLDDSMEEKPQVIEEKLQKLDKTNNKKETENIEEEKLQKEKESAEELVKEKVNQNAEDDEEECKYFESVDISKIEFLTVVGNFINAIEKRKVRRIVKTSKRKVEDTDLKNNNSHLKVIPEKKPRVIKKNKEKINYNLANEKFPLPLSPAESDKSIDKKELVTPLRTKRNTLNKANNQRYSSDDLYKPRPTFASSRRRGAKNLEN